MIQTKDSRSPVGKAEENCSIYLRARRSTHFHTSHASHRKAERRGRGAKASNGTCCGQKGCANLLQRQDAISHHRQEKTSRRFAPQTTSIRKRTPSSKKTVKSYSEMNLAEFCRRRRSGKIPLMKASCGTFLCAKTVDHSNREEDVSKNWNGFEFRGTQFCRNRREEAFERSRPKGKRPVAGHSQKAAFINQRPLETMAK